MRRAGLFLLLIVVLGCSRTWWRLDADQETYAALNEKLNDPRWQLPRLTVDTPPASRLHDPTDPDYPPMPPDDPPADQFMQRADGHSGWKHWHRNGDLPSVEFPEWRQYLQLEPDGTLLLTPESAVRLALLHSREYQTQQEALFLTALALTLNRFEFAVHWFATNNTSFTHFGSGGAPTETNTLSTTSNEGFSKAFAAGGQLLVNFANSFFWEFTGKRSTVNGNFGMSFIQPLLLGAGRQVRLESLTEAERTLLYNVRTFAHFRKEFYFTIAIDQYQSLMTATQQIRNQETSLKSQEQNYLVIAARRIAGEASLAEEDQVYSSYKQAEIQLIQAKSNLEAQLDAYKLLLGLPPNVPVKLDDSILKPFEFVAPEIATFQEKMAAYVKSVARPEIPMTVDELRKEYETLATLRKQTEIFAAVVRVDVAKLKEKETHLVRPDTEATKRLRANVELLDKQSLELVNDIQKFGGEIDRKAANLTEAGRKESQNDIWKKARDLSNLVGQIYVIQTQSRIYLLELPVFAVDEQRSIDVALAERFDLMNQRAAVVDSWRQVEVAANRLKALLNLQSNMNLVTKADAHNPFDFSAAASTYTAGVEFEAPLNRQAERNAYRQVLINYQQSRRSFMALQDNIVRTIRQDVRQLTTDRLNFDINRQSLIATARQIEQNQYSLLVGENRNVQADTTSILNALSNLLNAQNTLIQQWFSYERGRLRLLLDMEQFDLDDSGIYRDARQFADRPAEQLPQPASAPIPGAGSGVPEPPRPNPPAASPPPP